MFADYATMYTVILYIYIIYTVYFIHGQVRGRTNHNSIRYSTICYRAVHIKYIHNIVIIEAVFNIVE